MTRMQAGTSTNSTTSDAAMYGPGTVWHTMGSATIQPQPVGESVVIIRDGTGFSISGPIELLFEYFESQPKFWLRLMAMEAERKAEEENGKAENGDD